VTQDAADLLTRRRLLQRAVLGPVGLSLPGLLRARAAAPARAPARIRACILIFYYGGPSHLDTVDPKPEAPAEVRGEFKPIATTVPGVRICEHLPRLARLVHKVAIIRSLHHANRLHDSASIETLTGRPLGGPDRELFAPTPQFFPNPGGGLSYLWRGRHLPVAHAALPFVFHNVVETPCQGAGFLGSAHNPFQIGLDADAQTFRADALSLGAGLTPDRLGRRRRLLDALQADAAEARGPYDRAFTLLASEAVRRALDVTREPARVRARYGFWPKALAAGPTTGAEHAFARHMRGQSLLLARRLVEAGVPFVSVYDFRQQGQNWDAHADNFAQHKDHLLPPADRALSALVEDLDARGLLETTLVVALGEFGRTPRINKQAGRDHWPDCYSVLLAGGGVVGGAVYGASDRIGAYPARDPVTPADLAATIYWRFGIDPATEIRDQAGRPYRLAEGEPVRKLFRGGA
jgi:uncharacterized protein (DUF1501 family)